jgi:hypothetical protein
MPMLASECYLIWLMCSFGEIATVSLICFKGKFYACRISVMHALVSKNVSFTMKLNICIYYNFQALGAEIFVIEIRQATTIPS